MSVDQKVSGINWNSDFLRDFLTRLLMILLLPHLFIWLPHWIDLMVPGPIGWSLSGTNDDFLPSLILSIAYAGFSVSLVLWVVQQMDSFNRFKIKTRSPQMEFEDVEIPVGGGKSLPGILVKGPRTPAKNAPVLVVCHGLGGSKEDFLPIGIPLTFLGFAVLFYDSRGHGASTFGNKWDTYYIIKDFSKVLDWVESRSDQAGDIDKTNIVAWGASMGGGIVLNEAYLDSRVKFVIAVCTWADFKMTATRKLKSKLEAIVKAGYEIMGINLDPTNLQNRMVSPIYNSFNRRKGFFDHPVWWPVNNDYRVMLAHCKDDAVVNYENFEINKKFLDMPRENYIVFEKGNHAFAGMETALVGKFLYWLFSRGF